MKTLKLVLSDHWFEEIKSGRKTHEYRKATPYWDKRIDDPIPRLVEFQKAYRKNPERMTFFINAIWIRCGTNTDLKCDCPVYDIWLGERVK